jgi:hypothetical protein
MNNVPKSNQNPGVAEALKGQSLKINAPSVKKTLTVKWFVIKEQ